jgi:pimeloyl-ACP methyl ester carboxylesterase
VLRAHLLEGVPFRKISLLDAVVLTPWGTPALGHVKEYLGAYRTMPTGVFEAYVAARLRETTNRPMDEGAFEVYLSQWQGDPSQAETLVGKIPGSRLRIVPGAGHFVMEDAPEMVAEILAEFFAEDPRVGTP